VAFAFPAPEATDPSVTRRRRGAAHFDANRRWRETDSHAGCRAAFVAFLAEFPAIFTPILSPFIVPFISPVFAPVIAPVFSPVFAALLAPFVSRVIAAAIAVVGLGAQPAARERDYEQSNAGSDLHGRDPPMWIFTGFDARATGNLH
jgi:hypothetical protein